MRSAPVAGIGARGNAAERHLHRTHRARLRRAWGDLAGALQSFDQAEPILEEVVTDYAEIAAFERERAACRLGLQDLSAARKLARDALSSDLRRVRSSRRRPEDDWVRKGDVPVAQSILLYAECHRELGDTEEAKTLFKTALELARKIEAPREQVRAFFGLARVALANNDVFSARIAVMGAMLRTQEGLMPDLHIETLALAGECSLKEGDLDQGIEHLLHGIRLVETMRLDATPEDRQRMLALQADHYRWLLECLVEAGRDWEALAVSEALKARNLREALAQDEAAGAFDPAAQVQRVRELQTRLPPDLAVVSYANADWTRSDPFAFV